MLRPIAHLVLPPLLNPAVLTRRSLSQSRRRLINARRRSFRHSLVYYFHVFPERVLLDALHLFFGEMVACVVNLLVVADWLGGVLVLPLDPGLPGLAQSDWVHASLLDTALLGCVLPGNR